MTEKLLQFLWQFQYYNKSQLQTTDREEIIIIYPGLLNKDQGPDFINARIKIGSTILVGSVEVHLKTSDWQKHKHENDINYKNVILHVVYQNDITASVLPVLELSPRVSKITLDRYDSLMNRDSFLACEHSLSHVREITWISWKERLLAERLSRKAQVVYSFLEQNNFNWETSFWWLIAQSFGGKVNADAFLAVAKSVPLTVLGRQKASIHQLEALLLGQAGLLHAGLKDSYAQMLFKEYTFLAKKYNLEPIFIPIHLLRMRPGSFPAIRLAQLAMLVYKSRHLLKNMLESENINEVKSTLNITANDYWHYRYRFDEESPYSPKRVGEVMVNNLIINSIVPILFCYGNYHKNEAYKTKALAWLQHTRAEKNNITNGFAKLQVDNSSAFDSQALIELKKQYCDVKRCLECSIGNSLLRPT